MYVRAVRGKLIIEPEERETKVLGFMVNPEGKDNIIKGMVISVGNDITDIKVGDVVTLPGNQGHEVTIGDDYVVKVIQYGAIHMYYEQTYSLFQRVARWFSKMWGKFMDLLGRD